MTKADIVQWIAENKDIDIPQKYIKEVVNSIFKLIQDELKNGKNGDKVQISGFGTFMIKKRKAKIGRNPKTNEEVVVPERLGISFKPSKKLINFLNSN
ncbi:MAG: integration host factor subunit beta [Aquificota bacterium]|nr:MAG: integration host factor subunit beta [Aquificota bacterium]